MKKQAEVLIRTGKGKFIPVGTAEIEIETELIDRPYSTEYTVREVKLNRLNINIKNGDIIWERIKSSIFD